MLGRREVEVPGDACGGLDEALVLVLALAIDTQLAVLAAQAAQPAEAPVIEPTPSVSEPAPSEPPTPAPAPPVVAAPEPSAQPRVRRSSRRGPRIVRMKGSGSAFGLLLAVGTGLGIGLMPATAWDLA